jgi:SAM-dependent methyltransferase
MTDLTNTTNLADPSDPRDGVTTSDIALPPPRVSLSQDREWCVVEVDGRWRKIRLHDYEEIYAIPGLYETLFYDVLRCGSPAKIREMLKACLEEANFAPERLRVLDLGAGNGMVGAELARLGVRHLVGVDICRAAVDAAQRDRRGLYDDYLVADMTDLDDEQRERLESHGLNCLTCVAALGFGDIPPAAFVNAFNSIARGGWVAFNIKRNFLETDVGEGTSGFARLIRRMIEQRILAIRTGQEYEHRLATDGEPLVYKAFVGIKQLDVPDGWAL